MLVYGPRSDVAQECAALYYAGPEQDDEIGPQYGDNDEVSMRRVYEEGDDEENDGEDGCIGGG